MQKNQQQLPRKKNVGINIAMAYTKKANLERSVWSLTEVQNLMEHQSIQPCTKD